MDRTEHTNRHNVRFYVERACDFDDAGRVIAGRGWFAGLIRGRDDLSGVWFETKEAALDAIADYAVAA